MAITRCETAEMDGIRAEIHEHTSIDGDISYTVTINGCALILHFNEVNDIVEIHASRPLNHDTPMNVEMTVENAKGKLVTKKLK